MIAAPGAGSSRGARSPYAVVWGMLAGGTKEQLPD
jgi:hypothetical protein